jgi:hypothetical protein
LGSGDWGKAVFGDTEKAEVTVEARPAAWLLRGAAWRETATVEDCCRDVFICFEQITICIEKRGKPIFLGLN